MCSLHASEDSNVALCEKLRVVCHGTALRFHPSRCKSAHRKRSATVRSRFHADLSLHPIGRELCLRRQFTDVVILTIFLQGCKDSSHNLAARIWLQQVRERHTDDAKATLAGSATRAQVAHDQFSPRGNATHKKARYLRECRYRAVLVQSVNETALRTVRLEPDE